MNILRTFLFLCAVFGCCITEDIEKYRLPENVVPLEYSLKFQPFINENYFKGESYIKIHVYSPTDAIYLHGSSLNISVVQIVGDLNKVRFELEEKYELIKIYYENKEQILQGEYLLYFKYEGTLLHTDQMGMIKGLYPNGNRTEELVITDFQPTYARRAFPCFDEPALKALFNITVLTPNSSWLALSNTEEISHEETPEGIVYKFETSPPMSTDLISFAVTKMDFIENVYKDRRRLLKIRTFLGNAKSENQRFVLNFAAESVDYFQNFTGVEYPITKIDFIEYDKKFAATEYWGLTTFKRGLLNPTLDLYDTRQISIIVAHELTHYWFGNLVTNKWWRDIWLQEGFAQYLSHKVVDEILNTTNVDQYPLDYTIEVFNEDRDSKTVNPVVSNCTTPKEIMVQFNDITYIKAGSIIRLLDYMAGYDGFKKIIQKYFETFCFNSANTEDFIGIVDTLMPNSNFKEFLETWLYQNRFPIITIEENVEKKYYILRQQSASSFRNTDNMSPFGYRWTLPIIYKTDIDREPKIIWFKRDDEFITIPKGQENFIKLNHNFMGIYFTNYTTQMWQNLVEHVQILNELEQAQLTTEAEKLFEADIINCDISLKIIAKVSSEPNQYGVSPLSVLYTLRDNLGFDPAAISLLRKFYYSVKANSKLARKKEEESQNFVKKLKKRNAFDADVEIKSPEAPNPRYVKCAKWIHENLSYLI